MFENPRRGRQARNFTANVPKILDLKSSSEQIFSENCRWVPLTCAQPTCNAIGKTTGYRIHPLPDLSNIRGFCVDVGEEIQFYAKVV